MPRKLPNDLRNYEIRKYENLKTSWNYCLVLSTLPKLKILSALAKKTPEKHELNFSLNALFHIKTRVYLKYFMNNCIFNMINFIKLFNTSCFLS